MKNIKIYTTNTCGYCNAAKTLLEEHGLDYTEVDLSQDHTAKLELMNKTGQRTVPQIFIDDKFIGGYTELKDLLKKTP